MANRGFGTPHDARTYAAVNRQQCELLGLNAPIRLEHSDETDIVAVRKKLEDEVAEALAQEEVESDAAS